MEAPVLSGVYFFSIDILGHKLFRLERLSGQKREYDLPIQITSLALPNEMWQPVIIREQTKKDKEVTALLATGPKGLCIIYVGAEAIEIVELTNIELPPTVRFNDGKMSPDGKFYAGTMDKNELDPIGKLYEFCSNGVFRIIADDIVILNGPCFDASGNRMLYADSAKGVVYDARMDDGVDWRPHGHFAKIQSDIGAPDGMTFDSDGNVWIAIWGSGSVFQFDATGVLIQSIDVGLKLVTSLCHDRDSACFYVTGQDDLTGTGAIKCITFETL